MGHGGKREGAGRKAGQPNKANRELRDLAQEYTPEALATLAEIMRASESDAARVSAANSILDRAHGKPAQTIDATHRIIKDPAELADADLAHIASAGRDGAAAKAASPPEPSKLH